MDLFRSRVEASEAQNRRFHGEWKRNVELRLGRVASQYTGGVSVEDQVQTEVNPDWSLTKTKTANLYSQVPQVQLTHESEQFAAAIPPFAKSLNFELGEKRANVGIAMGEVLNDVVNAAGVGAVVVGYAARFETIEVPAIDTSMIPPAQLPALLATKQIETKSVQRVTSDRFYVTRVSPKDLLWPAEFTGSNFDQADYLGYRGRLSWAEAKHEFNLPDDQKEKVLGGARVKQDDTLQSQPESGASDHQVVTFKRVYYWRHRVDPEEPSFHAIWELVFVDGMEQPALHRAWKGQRIEEGAREYVGACKFPIRVLTLTYISDNPIPPSDSSAGRPQVNDLRRSRSQMFQNRERSVPLRWFDVNRVDPVIQDQLMRGTWQGMIPSNGPGDRSVGEIARASYPSEDLSFDRATKADLMESWQIGPNQSGTVSSSGTTKAEVETIQGNFATVIGQERGRVASFFLSIAEVLAGLMVLYSDFPILTSEERQQMEQAWDRRRVLHQLVLKIRPDSTVLIDSQERVRRLLNLLNMTAKSGVVNILPIMTELVELHGMDPAKVIKPPQTSGPEEPAMSYRFSGKDDLMNPIVMSMLIRSKQAPSPEELEAAKALLASAQGPITSPQPQPSMGPPPPPEEPVVPPTDHPDWTSASKVVKRSRDVHN